MPPVSGLLPPTDSRPAFGAIVSPRRPGAKISLFSRPRGSMVAGTSSKVIAPVRARQGRLDEAERMAREAVAYFAGTDYSTDRTFVLMDLAEVLRLAGRTDEAIATVREALDLFEQREDAVSAAQARALIGELSNDADG
jgi:tetratricopeptide (TPR) repeat protein